LRVGPGVGVLVCVLVPVALLLFGVVSVTQTASLVLLLAGLWTVVYGVALGKSKDRLYNVGSGIVVAVLSTFIFLPLQYTAGLVVVSIVAVVLASVVVRPRTGRDAPPRKVG
jgi:uncharacterized membrane protein HdeD (DUF308 family)